MPILPFLTEQFPGGNKVGLGGAVTNVDNPNRHPEDNFSIPWLVDPVVTWLEYRCTIEVLLDPGTVLHKPLPQSAGEVDGLGVIDITSEAFAAETNGINLYSKSTGVDIIQRMATSTYTFVLRGEGWRAGYQIPIPNLLSVGGTICVPTNPHLAGNYLAGNLMGGIPLWYAAWELHYLVATPPRVKPGTIVAAPNPAAAIRPNAELPAFVILPQSPTDSRATQEAPLGKIGIFGNFVRNP